MITFSVCRSDDFFSLSTWLHFQFVKMTTSSVCQHGYIFSSKFLRRVGGGGEGGGMMIFTKQTKAI